jgi:cytochrome c-type biogenesis protein CcmE
MSLKPRHKKFVYILAGIALLSGAVGLVLYGLKDNVSLYFTPTQVVAGEVPVGRSFRIGGLVEIGSVSRTNDVLTVTFKVTDSVQSFPVSYTGILPDLFTEDKGVVVRGKLGEDGVMYADEVLAKHDENYMPPEALDAMEQAEQAKLDQEVSIKVTAPEAAKLTVKE